MYLRNPYIPLTELHKMDLGKVCRLCGINTGKRMYNIFEKDEKGQQIVQLIKKCLPIIVYRTDPLSKCICEECYFYLDTYYNFMNQCINAQEFFRSELLETSSNKSIQLYFNTLEDHQTDFLTSFQIPYTKSLQMKNISCQASSYDIDEETAKLFSKRRNKSNVTVLTPELINEIKIDSHYLITATSQDGTVIKKRKIAGPKSSKPPVFYRPPTLLQCALRTINQTICPEEMMDSDSRSFYNIEIDEAWHSYENDCLYNTLGPVFCNYCMKGFSNYENLSRHEVSHMLVDIGPRVENRAYQSKFKYYYNMYLHWRKRVGDDTGDETEFDTDTSLLVPDAASVDHEFDVIDNEITVDGIPLKNYDKAERRTLYKSIIVDGVKRKFCPICRHTFKDNWAIDIHYLNSSCQYTCKFCGMKFKFHKDLFPEHLKLHEGEPCNKIFGPADRRTKLKKRKVMKLNRYGAVTASGIPKIKPIKMKHLLQKRTDKVEIKTEPGTAMGGKSSVAVNLEKTASIQPYQAYFCRKCFKVFFKIDEFNSHTSVCKGTGSSENESEIVAPSEQSQSSESPEPEQPAVSKRPQRSCVRDFSLLNDSDSESIPGTWSPKPMPDKDYGSQGSNTGGFECGVCCSSFPSRHSRNSHMRIHKGQKIPAEKVSNYYTKSSPPKPEPKNMYKAPPQEMKQGSNIRLASLNPTVARLVQNNPHLTIRSYTKPMETESPQPSENDYYGSEQTKRAYRCLDCNSRFENKSLLYYHKLQNCIVKRHYECAFCKKKFGTQEQYNTHMLYVHPE